MKHNKMKLKLKQMKLSKLQMKPKKFVIKNASNYDKNPMILGLIMEI